METFRTYDRIAIKAKLKDKTFDLLVIGGGITGAGIALDAVQRGFHTALVDMQDFAAGTSSRSTKLIHGGLRYLKQLEFKLVAEVGKERAIVYENGPHVTTPEWMLLPFYKGGSLGPWTTSAALKLYDYLAGVQKQERRKMLSVAEVVAKVPHLKQEDLLGGGFYVEYKTDDARLTIEVLKKAVELGAIASNYMKVIDLIYEQKQLNGVIVRDEITQETFPIYARKIINATGTWVDTLRKLDGSQQGKKLFVTKGVHLVFSQERFPLQQAIYFDTDDRRMIFAIPRGTKTYVGTTDTHYTGDYAHPYVTAEDRDYLLRNLQQLFPTLALTAADVESSWAGLRALFADAGEKPSEISRKDEIFFSPSGLISIAGGKLTGYRKMAEKVVDLVVQQLREEEGIIFGTSQTKRLPISGGDVGGSENFTEYKKAKIRAAKARGIEEAAAKHIVATYGSNCDTLFTIYTTLQEKAQADVLLLTELEYALEYEAIVKPSDFFIRRTGQLLFSIDAVIQNKEKVCNYMAEKLGWSDAEKTAYQRELTTQIDYATLAYELS